MLPKGRVLAAIEFAKPDRIPVGETMPRAEAQGWSCQAPCGG